MKNENGFYINLRKVKQRKSRQPYTHHIRKNKDRYKKLYLGQGILIGGFVVSIFWLISIA